MRRDILAIIALLAILAVMVGGVVLPFMYGPLVVHGYDGPVAKIVEIDHDYPSEIVEVTDTHASVYPDTDDIMDLLISCGLRMEIQAAPNVLSQEVIDTLTKNVVDDVAKTNITKTVEVKKVKCDMTIHVSTYQGGLASALDTTFWIQVSDNAHSVFTNADNNIVWIAHIYTREVAIERGSMEFIPTSGGYTFPLTTVSKHPVPQWLIDAGYQPEGELFEVVKFPIRILSGVPSYTFPNVRTESSVSFDIGFDCILVGEWREVHDYLEGEWLELPDFLGDLLAFLTLFAWVALGFLATILIFRYVPDLKVKLIATGIVWIVLLALYGFAAIETWLGGG